MARTVAIGEQDFSKIIERNYFYVDKTDFIRDWWESGDAVTLIARPRRFGKTLTMKMVEQFFSVKYAKRSDLFENLRIWEIEKYRKLQGTYPVIFLSFAGIKGNDYKIIREKICQLIVNLYSDHRFLVKSGFLEGEDLVYFEKVTVDMNDAVAAFSIGQLSRYLYHYYGKKVIILLDEYDTPMQEAYIHGYWEELAEFIRGLFNSAFKENSYLERSILTGITRVSKESIFSELNNLIVVSAISRKYETSFGFTETEVLRAIEEFGLKDQIDEVRQWYDGFRFGDCEHIYNPWSITRFLDAKVFASYWANTSSNRLVSKLVCKSDASIKLIMEELLQGNSFYTQVDEEIIYRDLDRKKSALWSLLLASGYLKVQGQRKNRRGKIEYELTLTNREIVSIFDDMVTGWFSNHALSYGDFTEALLAGNKRFMNEYLNTIALETFSYFDTGLKSSSYKQPENFYHGFVLGMIADLRTLYKITSNRESGEGRYDVLLDPYDPLLDDGIILEFKVMQAETEKTLQDTAASAIKQIIDKKYAVTLETKCGRDRIRIYGFAFQGKEVLIDGGYLDEAERVVTNKI